MSVNPNTDWYKTKAESVFFMGSYVHLKVPDGEEKWEELPERDHQSHSQTGALWFKAKTTSGQENVRIRILPLTNKQLKKTHCFVTSKLLAILTKRIRIRPSTSKKIKKTLDFFSLGVTSKWLVILKIQIRNRPSTPQIFFFLTLISSTVLWLQNYLLSWKCRSGSFHQQSKKLRKTLISMFCFVTSKWLVYLFLWASWKPLKKRAGSGSVIQCRSRDPKIRIRHGPGTLG